jgi:hypothetical protein
VDGGTPARAHPVRPEIDGRAVDDGRIYAVGGPKAQISEREPIPPPSAAAGAAGESAIQAARLEEFRGAHPHMEITEPRQNRSPFWRAK